MASNSNAVSPPSVSAIDSSAWEKISFVLYAYSLSQIQEWINILLINFKQ